LKYYLEPNERANVILTWASKAATLSYNFGFANYSRKIKAMRPYFTPSGWESYQAGIQGVVDRIVKNQLIVQGVVSGTPVISNQGELPGKGYTWRVQIPFLVTYLSSDQSQVNHYYVIMTIVKVPTYIAPEGIGIDTFEMRR
jgi:intracellular multiplication protein IcmL